MIYIFLTTILQELSNVHVTYYLFSTL